MGSFSLWHWIVFGAIVYFFVRVFKRPRKQTTSRSSMPTIAQINGPGTFAFEVVGESNYLQNFIKLFGERSDDGVDEKGFAHLVLEDDNPHDKSAVCVEINGLKVGYLSRDLAQQFRRAVQNLPEAASLSKFQVASRVRGGWDRGDGDTGHFGVYLDLPES